VTATNSSIVGPARSEPRSVASSPPIERHIQNGLIVQGLLQYLAVFHRRAVWRFFGSWLRTENHALAPSELVVAHALRNSLPDFLLSLPCNDALKKFLAPKLAPERCPNICLIELDHAA
jgi:hypothetical protein